MSDSVKTTENIFKYKFNLEKRFLYPKIVITMQPQMYFKSMLLPIYFIKPTILFKTPRDVLFKKRHHPLQNTLENLLQTTLPSFSRHIRIVLFKVLHRPFQNTLHSPLQNNQNRPLQNATPSSSKHPGSTFTKKTTQSSSSNRYTTLFKTRRTDPLQSTAPPISKHPISSSSKSSSSSAKPPDRPLQSNTPSSTKQLG